MTQHTEQIPPQLRVELSGQHSVIFYPDSEQSGQEIIKLQAAAPAMLEALRETEKAADFVVNDAEPGENAQLTVEGYNRLCAAIGKARTVLATIEKGE